VNSVGYGVNLLGKIRMNVEFVVTQPRRFWFKKYIFDEIMMIEGETYDEFEQLINEARDKIAALYSEGEIKVYYKGNRMIC